MTRGVGYSGTRDPNIAGVSSSGVSGSGVIATIVNVAAAQWNPADKDAGITISNNGRTITAASGTDIGVRATVGKATGKYYYEAMIISGTTTGCWLGIGKSTLSLTANAGSTGGAAQSFGGTSNVNGSATGNLGAYTQNQVVGIAVDLDAKTITFSNNNASPNTISIAAIVNGTDLLYPAASLRLGSVVANFAAADWVYSPPANHGAWIA